jgi:hypothetical protein
MSALASEADEITRKENGSFVPGGDDQPLRSGLCRLE